MKSPRDRVRDLIELATTDGGNEKERLVAAVKAVELIKKHDLLTSPVEGIFSGLGTIDNETVQAAGTLLSVLNDPKIVSSAKKLFGGLRKRRRR